MSLPSLRAIRVSALCALGVLPAVSLASGGFHCVPSASGPSDIGPSPSVTTLTVLHGGDSLAPTAALVALERSGGFLAVPSSVASTGSARKGQSFTYAPLDTSTDLSVSVRLPFAGPCGRGACDLNAPPMATLVVEGVTTTFTCTEL